MAPNPSPKPTFPSLHSSLNFPTYALFLPRLDWHLQVKHTFNAPKRATAEAGALVAARTETTLIDGEERWKGWEG
ncbi:hypothetical protein CVT24_012253 [Panaeolus cyanescens]|uniref:Uncharacterized protein n=1 Tax=Panaeolus cyanescens TaxID=181874 RepID=A0A409WDU6_9AGAR|nr:hypothetical protein CVT24_012253 [Panaeolus cyanescens]